MFTYRIKILLLINSEVSAKITIDSNYEAALFVQVQNTTTFHSSYYTFATDSIPNNQKVI